MGRIYKTLALLIVFLLTLNIFGVAFATEDSDVKRVLSRETSPVVRVISYEINNGSIEPGKEFEIEFVVENSNKYVDAYNISIGFVVTLDDTIYLDMGVTNQTYIEYLAGGETTTFTKKMHVLDNCIRQITVLSFYYYYENDEGVNYENSTDISPEIILDPPECEMEVYDVQINDTVNIMTDSIITAMYKNIGETDIVNAIMNVRGDISGEEMQFELDDMLENEYSVTDSFITFESLGEKSVYVSFEYESEDGKKYTVDEEKITVNVIEQPEDILKENNDNIFNKLFDYSGSLFKMWILLCGIIVIMGIGITVLIFSTGKGR